MDSISGKKIFVLYPDEALRNIFHGELRNSFAIYYMYDYEKVSPLASSYPGCIIVLNLIGNELGWLPEELRKETEDLPEEQRPSIIAIYDIVKPLRTNCDRSVQFQGNPGDLKYELKSIFIDLGGKGRRNFVRYGGNGENIASIILSTELGKRSGVVHDISISGLSFSTSSDMKIASGQSMTVRLELASVKIEIETEKILERNFDGNIVHVLKFKDGIDKSTAGELNAFIHSSLDAEMELFIKKLSN